MLPTQAHCQHQRLHQGNAASRTVMGMADDLNVYEMYMNLQSGRLFYSQKDWGQIFGQKTKTLVFLLITNNNE